MLKKLVVVAVVAAVAMAALKGTRVVSYARTEAHSVREWADDQIPVEKKISQMRREVGGLDRDVERVKDELAKEIVEVRELTNQVGALRAQVEGEQKALVSRGDQLKDATEKVSIGRSVVSVSEAKDMLKRDVNLHLKRKQQLDSMDKTLAHRERIRDTLEKQLDSMSKQKQELKAEIDAVEAEYKSVQLAQIESKYQNDDSRLSRVKESLTALRKKMDVEREKLKLSPRVYEDPSSTSAGQSVDDILAPLTSKAAKSATIDKTE